MQAFVRALTSEDRVVRSNYAAEAGRWSVESLFSPAELAVIGQLCIWAWAIEQDAAVAADLLDAVSTLQWDVIAAQIAGVAHRLDRTALTPATLPSAEAIDEYLEEKPPQQPRLLEVDACRRALDLARGITSTATRERLSAARLTAEVVASRALTHDEAGCFAGLLSYAIVIESDPAVRREQATALGIAAHHGRLSPDYREVALGADLTDVERSGLGTLP